MNESSTSFMLYSYHVSKESGITNKQSHKNWSQIPALENQVFVVIVVMLA